MSAVVLCGGIFFTRSQSLKLILEMAYPGHYPSRRRGCASVLPPAVPNAENDIRKRIENSGTCQQHSAYWY
jgi:hypothetical protein